MVIAWVQRRNRRTTIAMRTIAAVVATLCVLTLTMAGIARSTVLSRQYYQLVLDDQHAYDRLYDEVLVDPASAPTTRDLLARLPVPNTTLLANLKIVLPPTTLRQLVDEQITHAVKYLRGDTSTLGLTVNLAPVVANIAVLAEVYLGDLVAAVQERSTPDFPAFVKSLDGALNALSEGRRPAGTLIVNLDPKNRATAVRILLNAVPNQARASVEPAVEAAMDTGDLPSALAAIGPYILTDRSGTAGRDLASLVGNVRWDIVPDLESAGIDVGAVKSVRSVTRLALGPVQILAIVLGLLAIAFLWVSGASAVHRRLMATGGVLAAGGALTLIVILVVRWQLHALTPQPSAGWPPSLRSLVVDLEQEGASSFLGVGLIAAVVPMGIGLLLLAGAWVYRRFSVVSRFAARHQVLLLGGIGVLVLGTLIGATIAPAAAGHLKQRCLGSARMCALRYDQTAFLATHNSMSSTAAKFIGPLQDPSITSQLDEGARALLIDTHLWERPDEVFAKVQSADFPADLKAQLPDLINLVNPPKPGPWLCHAICRAGAIPLVPTLKQLGAWLDAHPGEIVTLIIQDEITGKQTEQAFTDAGLDRLIYTPSADPNKPWPTLGEMVRDNKRLVVFAEQADGPAPWYRNFYRYGMETPFAFTSASAMSCEPNRGGTGKRLFLLNHFITASGGSRLDAGEVNTRQFLLDRVHRCEAERSSPVTFVAVDYASLGDTEGAVEALNAERLARL